MNRNMRKMYTEEEIAELIQKDVLSGDVSIGGDLSVGGSINGEENPSMKPIYCHPITIDHEPDSGNIIHVSMLIFDNSNEEYNTLAKLQAKLETILDVNSDAFFPITGAIYYSAGSNLLVAQKIDLNKNVVPNRIEFKAIRPNGTQGYFVLSDFALATIYDGVNKIN